MGVQPTPRSVRLCGEAVQRLVDVPRALTGLGLQVQIERTETIRDTYLDTADWWLYRAGTACRVRRTAEGNSLAIEPLSPERIAPTTGFELEEELARSPGRARHTIPGRRLAGWLRSTMGDAPVQERLEAQRERTTYRCKADRLELYVAADRVCLAGPGGQGRLAEVEVTLLSGLVRQFKEAWEKLAAQCSLRPCSQPTLCRGLALVGAAPTTLAEDDSLKLRPDDRAVDAAYRVLRRHFGRMLWNEPGTRLGLDPEYLHDMRVATRRMRAALRLFRGTLPPGRVTVLRRELRWLGNALGRVRDLDVYLMSLTAAAGHLPAGMRDGLDVYLNHVRTSRGQARRAMLRALSTKRYAQLVQSLERFLTAGPPHEPARAVAARPLPRVARKLVRTRLKRVLQEGRAAGRKSTDEELHRLRIRCKRLRYACEFFQDVYGAPSREFARRVRRLQDLLGLHQDAVVASRALGEFVTADSPPTANSSDARGAVDALREHYAEQARVARRRFFAAWREFNRKKVRSPLKQRLDRLLDS